ncbi:MAG: hypothetical protein LBE31_05985, partial [Deltaproteobacteria bacterium]|nr:hypothetical protein [Deltaproteobacteria bacterium]
MSQAVPNRKFSVEYILGLLLHAGLIGRQQSETIKNGYQDSLSKSRGRSKVGGQPQSQAPTDPLDFVTSLRLPLVGQAEGRLIDDDVIARLMAKDSNLPYRRVEQRELDLEYITSLLPRSFATRHLVLPLGLEGNSLAVAVRHPFCQAVLDDVRRVVNHAIQPVILSQSNIKKLVSDIYAFSSSVQGATGQFEGGSRTGVDVSNLEQYVKLKNANEISDDDQHIKNLIDLLFAEAFEGHASDIHLEPKREHL